MKIKDIKNAETINALLELGFQPVQILDWERSEVYGWFEGRKRKGKESPTLVIYKETGEIKYYMNSTWIVREIPDVLLTLFELKLIVKGE